jgi:hypothetical protein
VYLSGLGRLRLIAFLLIIIRHVRHRVMEGEVALVFCIGHLVLLRFLYVLIIVENLLWKKVVLLRFVLLVVFFVGFCFF